ncbi:glycosyltransferase family 4 protein [Haloarcula sp. CGMCC 1.6347]|uniref:glycosyltransferase family 4 protein n=1 Tax=Haloarcula sp. CGMCC 1.6347 TaxID=3111455 RepID=UPI00300F4AF9
MKLLVVTPDFPPNGGGIGNLAYNYAKFSSFDVDILTNKETKNSPDIPGTDIHRVSLTGISGIIRCQIFIYNNSDKYDMVYFVHPFQSISGVIQNMKYIVQTHGNELLAPNPRQQIMKQVIKLGLQESSGIISNSQWTQKKVSELGISHQKVIQIPPGVPPNYDSISNESQIRSQYNLSEEEPILLTVGRLVERKGHEIVIEAIKDLDVNYFICGSGRMENQLKQLVESEEMNDKVYFEGYVPEEQLPEYYAAADLFVMPSKYLVETGAVEGFGIVFLEANSFGLPVIGADTGGIPSAINHRETGLVVQPTATEINEAIKTLLNDSAFYSELSQNAKNWARKHHWDKIGETIDQFIMKNYNPSNNDKIISEHE